MSDPQDLQALLDEAWRHLTRGVADARAPARTPTFVTVAPDGTPQARTVALRAAQKSTATLEIHTDLHTAKITALRQNPIAAFHVWIPRSDLQIRLTTRVEILTGPDTQPQWERVPAASRVSYGTAPDPGRPIADAFAYDKPAVQARFAVLRCAITHIDLVHLGTPHRRAGYHAGDKFAGQWLAP
jgi:pyridoxamine 5'-phosphate oxidase